MKGRAKAIKTHTKFPDFNCHSSQTPCNKHPYSYIGICPYCLTERLSKLVCSECGKRRVSSCSCFNVSSSASSSSNRNIFDVGSVGRLSFFIDNENIESPSKKMVFLRRSSSSCVEVKEKSGFWRVFGKKRNKNGDEVNGVSRSVSFSNAKISDVSKGIFFDSKLQFGSFSNQTEIDRVCNFPKQSVFPVKESDFSHMDDSEFIDLRLDSMSKSNQDFFCGSSENVYKIGNSEIGGSRASLKSKWGLWKKGFLQGSKK